MSLPDGDKKDNQMNPDHAAKCNGDGSLFKCVKCSSTEAYDVLTACLHVVCKPCLPSLEVDGLYKCCSCGECSTHVINNPTISKSEGGQESPKCNWCDDNGEKTKSVGNCKECDVWLCDECLKGHNRMPPLRNHSIIMLSKTVDQDSLHCEAHPHETLECFCEACGILTCRDCQLSVHRDHGSHRWVGEKATMLKTPLEEAVLRLTEYEPRLIQSAKLASTASTSIKDDSFLGSVEKSRLAIEARASSLILRIRSRTDALLKELDKKCEESVQQLMAAEALMEQLQEQIRFTLAFANRLIKHKDTHPANLVQLFEVVRNRLECLHSRSERLVIDAPPSADAVEASIDHLVAPHPPDLSTWRKASLGWRATANTRALFFGNWDPEDLARHSGQVAWLPKPHTDEIAQLGKSETNKESNGVSAGSEMKTNGNDRSEEAKTDLLSDESSYGDFLDNMAELDNRGRRSSAAAAAAAGLGPLDSNVTGDDAVTGCAICFGAGLLAHCGKCRRAYHLDCHLPRLTSISLVPGWVCGLCADQEAATAAHVEPSDESGLSQLDYLTGCRILMGLLVHAEAIHFTATVCPACSVPLLQPGRVVKHCPAGHLYHRMADLRLQLEEAALCSGDSTAFQLSELAVNGADSSGHDSAGGRSRLTRLDDWLVEVDKFWSDASSEDEHFKITGTSKGCLRAARRLRARLTSLVRMHRPQSLASLSALCTTEMSSDDASSTTRKEDDMDSTTTMDTTGKAEFQVGAE